MILDLNLNLGYWRQGGGAAAYEYVPIILKLGQSNSLGFSERTRLLGLTSYVDKPDGVKRYIQLSFGTAGGGWMDYMSGLQFGSGAILGKKLRDQLGTDIYIIEGGRGGASLRQLAGNYNDFDPTSGILDCYENAMVKMFTDGILKIPNPNSLPLKVLAIEWHQADKKIR